MKVTHEGVDYVFYASCFDCHKQPIPQACYRCGGTEWDREVLHGCEVATMFEGRKLTLHRKCMTYSERVNWEND